MALPGRVVCGVEGLRQRLPGTFQRKAWGIGILRIRECLEILSPMGSDPGRLAGGPSSRRVGHRGRYPPFP